MTRPTSAKAKAERAAAEKRIGEIRDEVLDTRDRAMVSSIPDEAATEGRQHRRRPQSRRREATMATGSKAAFESATKNGVLVIDVAEGACQDGCGETVAKGRKFRQGHDARLRGMLNQAHRSGTPVKLNGKQTTAEAVLTAHGLPMPAERKPRVRKSTAAKKTTAKKSTAKRGTSRKRSTSKAATPAAS